MVQAYVFIQISSPNPLDVLATIRIVPQVKQVHIVLGPIDCIAFVECTNHEDLQQTILEIRWISGVTNTDTRYVYA